VAQSEIPVAWIGLGGMVIGAVATAVGARYTTLGGVKAATIDQLVPLQTELHSFTSPFVEARHRLVPLLGGLTPSDPWTRIAPSLPRHPPTWCSMTPNPLALYDRPETVRRSASQVDDHIRSHQARGARTLAPDAHISVRALYRELGDAVDDFTRALKRLARRGLGVI
jgi:hypothetical protein